jgi:hypothetical protein
MTDTKPPRPTDDNSPTNTAADAIEQRVLVLAEQLGRLVGAAKARSDGWLDRQALNEQLTRIRDGAAGLLGHLGPTPSSTSPAVTRRPAAKKATAKPSPRAAAPAARVAAAKSRGKVDAPGKKHRKAPAPTRGVKHSDQTISKLKAASQPKRARRG